MSTVLERTTALLDLQTAMKPDIRTLEWRAAQGREMALRTLGSSEFKRLGFEIEMSPALRRVLSEAQYKDFKLAGA